MDSRPFHPVLHIKGSDLQMGQVSFLIEFLNMLHPDREYFIDGDEYAIGFRQKLLL